MPEPSLSVCFRRPDGRVVALDPSGGLVDAPVPGVPRRVLAGVATPGIAGRPGFLCGFSGESAVLPIQVVVTAGGAGPTLIRFAAESVLPVLDGGKLAWACVETARLPPRKASAEHAVALGGEIQVATGQIDPIDLLRRLRACPGLQPEAARRLVPPVGRNLAQRREIDGVAVWFTTANEYNRWAAAAEPLSRPLLGQKDSVLRVSDAEAEPANRTVPKDAANISIYEPWRKGPLGHNPVGGMGRAIAQALGGAWPAGQRRAPTRLAWLANDELRGPAGKQVAVFRDGGAAQEFAATTAASGSACRNAGGNWTGAGSDLLGVRRDGLTWQGGKGLDHMLIPGALHILACGGVQVIRAALLGADGASEVAVQRFLVADPADVLFVQGHHAEGGWAAWQAGEDGKVVTTGDWLEGLRLGQLARGREMRPMALVLLGCGVLMTAPALAAARAAMTAGAVDVILGTSAEVSFRDEFAAIQGTGHPRRSALLGARAAVAAWAVAQVRAGAGEVALRRWVECATVLAGYPYCDGLTCGVALGMVGKDKHRQIAMVDPRESAMYAADGGLFRCVGQAVKPKGGENRCPVVGANGIGPRYGKLDPCNGLGQLVADEKKSNRESDRSAARYYLVAERWMTEAFRQRREVFERTQAGQDALQLRRGPR